MHACLCVLQKPHFMYHAQGSLKLSIFYHIKHGHRQLSNGCLYIYMQLCHDIQMKIELEKRFLSSVSLSLSLLCVCVCVCVRARLHACICTQLFMHSYELTAFIIPTQRDKFPCELVLGQ